MLVPEVCLTAAYVPRNGDGQNGSSYSGSTQASGYKTWRGLVIKKFDEQRSWGKLSP